VAYWLLEAGAIGAVADASFDAALAAMAEFEAALAEAIAAFASDSEAAAEFSAVFAAFCLQAATDTAAIAAPTIRIERSVPEVIVSWSQVEEGCSATRDATLQYDAFAIQGKQDFTAA
jgi:hypothetical protein